MHFYAFLTRCIYAYCSACWFRCILIQLHFNAFARLTSSDAFRLHYSPGPKPIRSMLHASCEFSFESARLLLCMFVWSTSLAHLCAFSRMLRYFYAFSRIMQQSWSKYHAISYSRRAWRIQIRHNVPPLWTGIRIYAHECIIVRMHQNATHWNAAKCANMHHIQNAYIR